MWPKEKISALILTFDFDAESAEYRKCPDKPVKLSKGIYGAKKGLPRILNLLDKHQIKATFFVCGWVAEKYPEITREIVKRGHEVAAHGYLHENLSELSYHEEEEVFRKTIKAIESVCKVKPKGFRAPYWEFSENTLSFLGKYEFLYDSSFMDDDIPYIIELEENRKIVELPVEWVLDDWQLFEVHRKTPAQVYETWISEIDAAYEERTLTVLTMHPQCIGRPSRIRLLDDLIVYAKRYKKLWITKAIDVAKWAFSNISKT
ncbi:MAG: polysaccharide deacetylase family protein [Candidatus Baldrarchaeia archaeon]